MIFVVLILVFIALAQLVVGTTVLFTSRRKWIGTLHAVHLISLGMWTIGMIFYLSIPETKEISILWWTRFLYFFGILSSISLFGFSYFFTSKNKNSDNLFWLFIGSCSILFSFLIFATNTITAGIEFHPGYREVLHGKLYPLFFTTLSIVYITSFFLLFRQLFSTNKEILKRQTKLILIAVVPVVTVGGIVNMILPAFWGNFKYAWVGPMILPTSAFAIYYAIHRYRFLNITFNIVKLAKIILAIITAATITYTLYSGSNYLFNEQYSIKLNDFYFSIFSTTCAIIVYLKTLCLLNSSMFNRFIGITNAEYFEKAVSDLQRKKIAYLTFSQLENDIQETFSKKLKIKSSQIILINKKNRTSYLKLIEHCEKNREILVTEEIQFEENRKNLPPFLEELKSLGKICLPLYHPTKDLIGFLVLGHKQSEKLYSKEAIAAIEHIAPYLGIRLATILHNSELRKEVDEKTHELNEKTTLLQIQNKEMQKLLDQQSDFIAASGHELRTPANVASMYMSVLEEKLEDDKTKKYFSAADAAIRKLIALIQRLLEVQHHDRNRIRLDLKKIDIQEFMQETCSDIKPIAKEESIAIHCENKLPKDSTLKINLDPVQIRQVVQNLITNAIKFVPKNGTGEITLRLEEVEESKNIIISVTDNGCGVPEKTKEIIFDKFRSNHILDGNGIGLGLYLCKKIVELHRGKIWCEDNPEGKGSVFRVQIPQN